MIEVKTSGDQWINNVDGTTKMTPHDKTYIILKYGSTANLYEAFNNMSVAELRQLEEEEYRVLAVWLGVTVEDLFDNFEKVEEMFRARNR